VNIYLIGPRGAGKSAAGGLLAEACGRPFCDMDAELVRRFGQSIQEVVQAFGWPAFRREERTLLNELAARGGWVVSTGGGVVLDGENIAAMRRSGRVVWLRAAPETLLNRIQAHPSPRAQRPALTPGQGLSEEIRQTLREREALYRRAMHFCVDTDQRSVEAVCGLILAELGIP
jgi:shikimate kinase